MGALCCHSKLSRPDVHPASKSKERPKVKLLLIGLDNAGKTSTVMHLLGRPLDSVVPTIGFSSMQMAAFKSFAVEIYDLGGGEKIRAIWTNYFALVHGVIYVLDSTDSNRLTQVATLLESIMKNELISQKPILILINKQDVESALEEAEITQQLNLSQLANQYQCPTRMECTSATSNCQRKDAGIEAGYAWLVSTIIKNWPSLSSRVEGETQRQLQIERDVMNERYKRYRNQLTDSIDLTNSPLIHDENKSKDSFEPLFTPFRPITEIKSDEKTNQQQLTNVSNESDENICKFQPIKKDSSLDNVSQSRQDNECSISKEEKQMQHVVNEKSQVKVLSNEFVEKQEQVKVNSTLASSTSLPASASSSSSSHASSSSRINEKMNQLNGATAMSASSTCSAQPNKLSASSQTKGNKIKSFFTGQSNRIVPVE